MITKKKKKTGELEHIGLKSFNGEEERRAMSVRSKNFSISA